MSKLLPHVPTAALIVAVKKEMAKTGRCTDSFGSAEWDQVRFNLLKASKTYKVDSTDDLARRSTNLRKQGLLKTDSGKAKPGQKKQARLEKLEQALQKIAKATTISECRSLAFNALQS